MDRGTGIQTEAHVVTSGPSTWVHVVTQLLGRRKGVGVDAGRGTVYMS